MRPLHAVPAAYPRDRVAIAHGYRRMTFAERDARSYPWARTLHARDVRDDAGKLRKP